MKSILAYGDGNTWGMIPGSSPIQRYPHDIRWTGILQKKIKNVRVLEEGLCGRTTVYEDHLREGRNGARTLPLILESQYPVDIVILMLGTNDCKREYRGPSYMLEKGIEKCLSILEVFISKDKILLAAPIALGDNIWLPGKDHSFDKQSIIESRHLGELYEDIAKRRGIHFINAADYATADETDDQHLNENGHRLIAQAFYEKLIKMDVL